MAKQGKLFEELVALLETTLSGSALVVSKNVRWIDRTTGMPREIDVAVGPVGGPPEEHVIFECRDRDRHQGVDWIEQIATKAKDVGAKHVVAVAKRGFQKGAQLKAQAHGVELRTLGEISLDVVGRWFKGPSFTTTHNGIECVIVYADAPDALTLCKDPRNENGCITLDMTKTPIVNEHDEVVTAVGIYESLSPPVRARIKEAFDQDDPVVSYDVRVTLAEPCTLSLRFPEGDAEIKWLRLRLIRHREVIKSEPVGASSYVAAAGELGQIVHFRDGEGKMPVYLSRTTVPDKDGNVTLGISLPGLKHLVPPGADPATVWGDEKQSSKPSAKRRKPQ